MRFELTVALKYLLPKWRQLSVSIISLISVLVISLVVWLVVLFLSVTEGMERKWVEELVALNAPVRMTPTEAYYQSYYYKIDSVSGESNYTTKTIGEKVAALLTDPYDPQIDVELSYQFPSPDRDESGRLKDVVKEGFEAIQALSFSGVRAQEYEVSFGNLRLQLVRENEAAQETQQTFLTQVSYIASHDGENRRVNRMVIPPSAEDYNHLLGMIAQTGDTLGQKLEAFFSSLELKVLSTSGDGFLLSPSLFPKEGKLKGIGIVRHDQISKVVIPQTTQQLVALEEKLTALGYTTTQVYAVFQEQQIYLSSQGSFPAAPGIQITLDEKIPFQAQLVQNSWQDAESLSSLEFDIEGIVQQTRIAGRTPYDYLAIAQAEPKEKVSALWVYKCEDGGCRIPRSVTSLLGEGLLVAKHFKNNGVRLGDQGYLSYYAQAGSSMQEHRIPIYVAGFYDPGMMPVGNKLIFVDPEITAQLRGNTAIADPMLGNGINIWLDRLEDAAKLKEELINSLEARGIAKYWDVQSFHDYEFTRPILDQLRSDKNLFTLIAVIILIVACSNIISMLILLVNDKKREIGILQSMGTSRKRIATIFGLCGFVTGLVSCIIGTGAAILTLKNLQSLVDLLSFFQGRDAFQAAFYGTSLPNDLSYGALLFVLIATLGISLLAGIIPAVKASRIRPSETLRAE